MVFLRYGRNPVFFNAALPPGAMARRPMRLDCAGAKETGPVSGDPADGPREVLLLRVRKRRSD